APAHEALGYDERSGFKIDAQEASGTTALAPLARQTPTAPAPVSQTSTALGPPAPPPEPPRAQARRAYRDRMQMLRRHKWLIIGVFLATLAAFALYTALAPREYTAYSVLLVNSKVDGETVTGGVVAPGSEDSKVLNQALILQQAPQIAERTAETLMDQTASDALSTVQSATARYTADGSALTPEALGEYIQEKVVTVEPAGEQVDAIRVEAVTEDAREAALIASIYTDQYLALTRQANRADVSETRELLEGQLVAREAELGEIEAQLEAFMTANNAAGLESQTAGNVSQINSLESQVDIARAEASQRAATLAQLQAEAASIQPRLAESAGTATSGAQNAALQTDIARLETLLNQALARNPQLNGDPNAHPDTRAMNQRIQALRAEQRRIAQDQAAGVVGSNGLDMSSTGSNGAAYVAELQRRIADERSALQGARARAASLSSRLSQARGELRQKPAQEVELAKLRRQRTLAEEA
ncbi:MAG: Wzz/FepE/Etk N-terminal domain-containing protein, partial [Bacteroidota bacterium]